MEALTALQWAKEGYVPNADAVGEERWTNCFHVSIRPRACFSPSYNKVKSQTKHVWLLTLL